MNLPTWMDRMLGRMQAHADDEARNLLDAVDAAQFDRLAALTGKSTRQVRDEVDQRALRQLRRVQELGRGGH